MAHGTRNTPESKFAPALLALKKRSTFMLLLCLLLRHNASLMFIFPNWFCVKSTILDFIFYSFTPSSKAPAPSG